VRRVDVFLETERLLLRALTWADADLLVELDDDPEVMRFLTGGRATPREVIERETLPRMLEVNRRSPGLGYWAALTRPGGEFVGWFVLRPTDRPGEATLGYRLRRSAWGCGYATEGSAALLAKGFTELGVQRVMATTMTVNARSRRVMEKPGLTFVRTFFEEWPEYIDGAEFGDVEYSLARQDWSG
jgi:RimJ/RimL family protein N-acetyltransferase